jgi:thymidine kinase
MQTHNKGIMSNCEISSVSGYLELFIGPMFSGKTSKLLELYKQAKFCDIPVAVFNHSLDTRYHDSMLSTHDKVMIPCIQTSSLLDLYMFPHEPIESDNILNRIRENIRKAEFILINEGQFFEDLFPAVIEMLKDGKKVYIAGLDGDFERKKFGSLLELIPLCDKVTKLTSLCSICKDGTPGIFSLRLTQEKQQTLIGSDNYIPVCRNCYESP